MSVKIWFTPQDGSSSAVGTEFSGADYIQKDLQNLANKFNPEATDGGVKVEDLNKEVLTEIDTRVEAKVGVERAARIADDAETLQSAKTYTDTSIATETSARTTADTETLQSAKSYTDSAVSNLATKDSVASAIADDHTHDNKTLIDSIKQSDIDKWNAGSTTDKRIISLTKNPTAGQYVSNKEIVAVYSISHNVIVISAGAFSGCDHLAELGLPFVANIGNNAFNACLSLTEVHLPNARYLGKEAFYGCDNLTEIHLPNVIVMDDWAFDECTKLQIIDMSAVQQIPTIGVEAIPKNDGLRIVVPKSLINEWKVADGWSIYADYIFTSPYPR